MKIHSAKAIHTSNTAPQLGMTRPGALLLVVLIAAAGGGGWWWTHRTPASTAAGESFGPAGTASAPANPASAASGAGGPGGPNARRFGGANRVQPVSVSVVRQQDVKVVLSAIGNISALNTATVRTRVDGELKAIRFKEGQLVKAGALLAEIDARSYEIALAQVQGQLARDQALLKNARLDLERYKDLLAKDSIAKQQVDTQDAQVAQLAATVQTDQAQVDNAKLQLSYTKIVAPISGRLGLKLADLGNVVRASDAAGIVTITQTQPISVVFAVPEANLPQITRKLKGTEPLTVEVWDREQRSKLATGKVSTTDNVIDAVTGTIKIKAEFANADGALFPNQFVNIKLQVNTLEAALAVPSTAIQRGPQGTFIYVVKPDNSVTVRRIRPGTTDSDLVSVSGDLAVGDKVVTDGADRLREGAKVEVITPAPRPFGQAGQTGQDRQSRQPAADTAARSASSQRPDRPAVKSSAPPQGDVPRAAATNAPPPAPTAAPSGASWIDNLPPEAQDRVRNMMRRLPPEEAAKVNKMSPDERRVFFQQMRERRQQQQSQ